MEIVENTTREVAAFVVSTPIEWTDSLKKAVYDGIADWYASMLAAHDDNTPEKLLTVLGYNSSTVALQGNGSTVFGRSYSLTALDSALINGYLAHALDYDDVHEDVRGHPSAVLLAALFAESEQRSVSGQALMEGYLIGMEVMCRLGKAVGSKHYELGWHSTASLGAIAAACAVARMCRFSIEATRHAISIAATQSSGLRIQFGTTIKPMHAGFAARAGLMAAKMAEANIEAAEEVLTGKIGFLSLVTQREDITLDVSSWQQYWSILSPGLWYKKYPCCSAAYHAIDAADELRGKYKFKAENVQAINLIYPPGGDTALIHQRPKNGIEGKFSAEYIVALKLTEDELSSEHFAVEAIPETIQRLIECSTRTYRNDIKASALAMPKGRFTQLEVKLQNGEVLTSYCECPTGSPAKPMSDADRQYKSSIALSSVDEHWRAISTKLQSLFEASEVAPLLSK